SELIWVDIVKKARGKVKYVDLHKALGLTQTLTDRILAEHTTRTYNDLKLYSRLVPMDELLDESVPLWTLIREAIEKRTEEGKSTAEIASEAGLSVCHIRNFKRAFRENKGDLFDALTILFPEFTTNDYKEISSILDARIAYISEMAEGTTYSDRVSRVKYGLDGATKIFKVYSHEDEARLEIDVARRTRTNQRNPYVPMPESEPIPYKGKYLVLWEDYGPSKLMDSRLAAAENTRYLRFEQFFDIKQFTQRQKNMHMESGLLKTIYALALFHSTNKDTSWLPESASKVPTFREYNEMIAVAERALVHEKDLRALLPRRAEYDSALKYFAEAISKTPDVGIHGDIKPDNTLQLKNGTVALCDFGCFRSASPLIDLAMLFASFDAMKYGRDQMRMFVDAYEFFRQEEDCALGYATNIFGPIDKYEASWQGTKVMALRMATKPALLAYMKERPFEGRSDLIITSNLSQAQYVH
ncbi:MAG: phosphotransferase, partial [Nanoarchaeota archaeon]|nr:phosphotransferase [Nanoarchaeota archaeon]